MLIGIYTDSHFSISSSVLSRVNGYTYSARLDSLVQSFQYMYKLFKDNGVELIVNCGDLTDSDLLRAEENSALYEALSYNPGIPELYILGNHEIKNKNSTISSTSILQGYPNIKMYNDIALYEIENENTVLVLVPYSADKDKYSRVYEELSKIRSDASIYLFSHMSYIGENYNNYIETEGLDKMMLTAYDNLMGIYNGHIHNSKDDPNHKYHQIGSMVGNSFGDNYSGGLPGFIILDTETGEFTRYPNPYAVLFFKMNINSIKDLTNELNTLVDNDKCIRIDVQASIKDQVSEYLEQNLNKYHIREYRLKVKYESNKISNDNIIESFRSYSSPYDALKKFTELEETPYFKEEMIQFLDKYIGGGN